MSLDVGDHNTFGSAEPSIVDEGIQGITLVDAVAAAGLAKEQIYVGKLGCSINGL